MNLISSAIARQIHAFPESLPLFASTRRILFARSLASDEQIAAMREAVARMHAALADSETYIEGDLDFHLALAETSQNALIPALVNSIVDLLREQRMAILVVASGPQRGQHHHKRILEAVSRHDPEATREAMRAHLYQVREDTRTWTSA